MIYTQEITALEDAISALTDSIAQSKTALDYQNQFIAMEQDRQAVEARENFLKIKQQFAAIEDFEKYAPGFKEKQRELRVAKRKLDLTDTVADFRYSETLLQNTLDQIAYEIADAVSSNIKVSGGNPFFEKGKHSCGGNCHGLESNG